MRERKGYEEEIIKGLKKRTSTFVEDDDVDVVVKKKEQQMDQASGAQMSMEDRAKSPGT